MPRLNALLLQYHESLCDGTSSRWHWYFQRRQTKQTRLRCHTVGDGEWQRGTDGERYAAERNWISEDVKENQVDAENVCRQSYKNFKSRFTWKKTLSNSWRSMKVTLLCKSWLLLAGKVALFIHSDSGKNCCDFFLVLLNCKNKIVWPMIRNQDWF